MHRHASGPFWAVVALSNILAGACGDAKDATSEGGLASLEGALALKSSDVDAIAELAKAAQLGVYLSSGLTLADQSTAPSAKPGWYAATFKDYAWLVYPGTAEFLAGTTERYRDPQTHGVIPAPPRPEGSPYAYLLRDEFAVLDTKKVVKLGSFTRDLRVASADAGSFEEHATTAGSFELQAPLQKVKLTNLTGSWDLIQTPSAFSTALRYRFDVSYKPGTSLYSTSVAANLDGAVPGAWSEGGFFQQVLTRDATPLGNLAIDIATVRAWAFTPDGVQLVRLPGAPLTSASFSAGAAGPSFPAPLPGGPFAEITGPAPDFRLPDRGGQLVSLSDPQFAGKIMLVNFCGSWCGPCKRELPALRRIQAAYEPQGLQVITVGTWEPEPNSYTLQDGFDLDFPVVAAGPNPADLLAAYGNISAIPTTYLLDRNHTVVRSFVGEQTKETFELLPLAMGLTPSDLEPPPPTHCYIGGQSRNAGPDPANPCQACLPGTDNLHWTPLPAGTSCGDDGTVATCDYFGRCVPYNAFAATYSDMLTSASVTRLAPAPFDQSWGKGSPDPAIGSDWFQGSLTGNFEFAGGLVELAVTADDQAYLFVDGALVVAAYDHGIRFSEIVDLTAGWHLVDVYYMEAMGEASLQVSWGAPGEGCVIDGEAHGVGPNPDNACQVCAPETDPNRWINAPAGSACDAAGGVCGDDGRCVPHNQFLATYRAWWGATVTRYEPAPVDHDWGNGRPDPMISDDDFTADLVGSFDFPGGPVEFSVTTDDGTRLMVDGQVVIDGWYNQPPTLYTGVVDLAPGPHLVEIEYYEAGGGAVLRASW